MRVGLGSSFQICRNGGELVQRGLLVAQNVDREVDIKLGRRTNGINKRHARRHVWQE